VAGIVLAAGSSSRLGRPKQLLDFGGRPFVRVVAETAVEAGLTPVVVVTGHGADLVAAAVAGLPVSIVHNAGWDEGQASSIRAGLAAAGERAGAAVFLLSDQPQVPAALVSRLAATHARTLDRFVAPAVNGQRATPVLFDRDTFPDLLALTGDAGGREVIARHAAAAPAGAHPLALVPWPDPRILLDVDTDADYRALIG
jgi:molybdenum cofactor cytidylyltransferase